MLLRRSGRPEGEVLRHRGLVSPAAEVLRGVLLLQPGRRPGPPAEDAGEGGRRENVPAPHPEQHRGGAPPDAHRPAGEQSPGRRLRSHPQGAPALHGRHREAGAQAVMPATGRPAPPA